MNIVFRVPCIDPVCKGEVSFHGDGERTVVGYRLMVRGKGETCAVCGKKMRLEMIGAVGPFGFEIAAYPPL